MPSLRRFEDICISLNFDSHTSPHLLCPVTGKRIVGEVEGQLPDWGHIPTVMFHIFEAGDLEYIEARLRKDITAKRKVLKLSKDEASNLEMLQEHISFSCDAIVIFRVTADNMDDEAIYVGLDLSRSPIVPNQP